MAVHSSDHRAAKCIFNPAFLFIELYLSLYSAHSSINRNRIVFILPLHIFLAARCIWFFGFFGRQIWRPFIFDVLRFRSLHIWRPEYKHATSFTIVFVVRAIDFYFACWLAADEEDDEKSIKKNQNVIAFYRSMTICRCRCRFRCRCRCRYSTLFQLYLLNFGSMMIIAST